MSRQLAAMTRRIVVTGLTITLESAQRSNIVIRPVCIAFRESENV